ncbi:hypothetical protein GGR56DRAFT_676409 [Xylariaceae sp. FL0804]|nr:hypothetical protein GGR56DRAFT_676409 [Xylariaceae sp. FL0804]
MGYPRGSKNPIYAYKHFADYRNKVMQKELEKEQPIWPLWLEDAFLDALLLIPQMGRQKFSSKTILYGRNMLITEYLWIYHWLLHPPQNGEQIPDRKHREKGPHGPAHPMFRGRKQVSSHIQVLKGFFMTLVTFHFIFPVKKERKDEDERLGREEEDTKSFKSNRVLISLADGRLPDERPNYEYFARLLNADNDVFLRPKQCWIYVSSSKVSLKEKQVAKDDGTTKKQISGHTAEGNCLEETDYPHIKLNGEKDYKDLPRTGNRSTVLLHEYTRSLSQKESSSVKDISNRWDAYFPELNEKLHTALSDTHPSDERNSRCVVGPCDTFNFEVVLDLHSTSKFPDGSELNGVVELFISRPDLHGHRWQSTTSVMKPEELHISEQEEEFWDHVNPIDVNPSHRPGCSGVGRCDCGGGGRGGGRDTISVPFPARSWANTFIKLAHYVSAERASRDARSREAKSMSNLGRSVRAEREAARLKREKEKAKEAAAAASAQKSKLPTPKELLSQVAMYQEIWSRPGNSSSSEAGSAADADGWTRRAVILWTFVPVHDQTDERGKTTTVPPGTNWRFLTKLDATSEYHQKHAYLSGAPAVQQIVPTRDRVMSPNPGFAHHVDAAMHENFSTAYDAAVGVANASTPITTHSTTSNASAVSAGLGGLTLPSHHNHHHHAARAQGQQRQQQHQHLQHRSQPPPQLHLQLQQPTTTSSKYDDLYSPGCWGAAAADPLSGQLTPPPTGALPGGSSYGAQSCFDDGGVLVSSSNAATAATTNTTIGAGDSLHHQLSFLSSAADGSSAGGAGTPGTTGAANDSFLASLDVDYMPDFTAGGGGSGWADAGAAAFSAAGSQWASMTAAAAGGAMPWDDEPRGASDHHHHQQSQHDTSGFALQYHQPHHHQAQHQQDEWPGTSWHPQPQQSAQLDHHHHSLNTTTTTTTGGNNSSSSSRTSYLQQPHQGFQQHRQHQQQQQQLPLRQLALPRGSVGGGGGGAGSSASTRSASSGGSRPPSRSPTPAVVAAPPRPLAIVGRKRSRCESVGVGVGRPNTPSAMSVFGSGSGENDDALGGGGDEQQYQHQQQQEEDFYNYNHDGNGHGNGNADEYDGGGQQQFSVYDDEDEEEAARRYAGAAHGFRRRRLLALAG